jgi:hypothetical protein
MKDTAEEKKTSSLVRAALVKAQAEMGTAKKNSTNPAYGSGPSKGKYADLASVTDAVRGPFAKHGLGWRHDASSDMDGVRIKCIIFHESGEEIVPELPLFLPVAKKDAQAYKSAVTYGKRTTLEAAAGIATDEDDDGNAASTGHQHAETRAPAPDMHQQEMVNDETGEVSSAATADPVISWGKDEGRHASELDRRSLSFHVQATRKSLADPSKSRWHGEKRQLLGELLAIAKSKGWMHDAETA